MIAEQTSSKGTTLHDCPRNISRDRSWEAYRDVARLGRKTRLPEAQRAELCSIFERVHAELESRKLITLVGLFQNKERLYQQIYGQIRGIPTNHSEPVVDREVP